MKKLLIIPIATTIMFAADSFRSIFVTINKAHRIEVSNPVKAEAMYKKAFIELKNLFEKSLEENKPSPNVMLLLGKLYLEGKGTKKNEILGKKLLCYSASLGSIRAKKAITKYGLICDRKITLKEFKK